MELQEPYYKRHQWPHKNVKCIYHQYNSLSTLQQRNPRTPKNMSLPIKNKYSHSPLPTRLSTTVLASSSLHHSSMLPKNPQQDGQPSRHRSTSDKQDSLQSPNPIYDHLWSISNPHNRRGIGNNKQSVYWNRIQPPTIPRSWSLPKT